MPHNYSDHNYFSTLKFKSGDPRNRKAIMELRRKRPGLRMGSGGIIRYRGKDSSDNSDSSRMWIPIPADTQQRDAHRPGAQC
eukprot:gene15656-4709_t